MNKVTAEDIKAIQDDKANLLGESEWEKDGAYRVYQIEDRYIAIIVYDWQSKWLMYESAEYITKENVSKYI
jgi:hypothetical protein